MQRYTLLQNAPIIFLFFRTLFSANVCIIRKKRPLFDVSQGDYNALLKQLSV